MEGALQRRGGEQTHTLPGGGGKGAGDGPKPPTVSKGIKQGSGQARDKWPASPGCSRVWSTQGQQGLTVTPCSPQNRPGQDRQPGRDLRVAEGNKGQTELAVAEPDLTPSKPPPWTPPPGMWCAQGARHPEPRHGRSPSPHLTAWPPRWACAPSRAWRGSSRPPPRAAAGRRGVSRGESRRRVRRPRSFIHSPRGRRACDLRAHGQGPPRGATPGGCGCPPPIGRTGSCVAGSRGPRTTVRQHGPGAACTTAPEPEVAATALCSPLPELPEAKLRRKGARAATGPRPLRAACGALWRREAGRVPGRLAPGANAGEGDVTGPRSRGRAMWEGGTGF